MQPLEDACRPGVSAGGIQRVEGLQQVPGPRIALLEVLLEGQGFEVIEGLGEDVGGTRAERGR